MARPDMGPYRALISAWMDEEPLTLEEESSLLEALKISKELRDYWFSLQCIGSILQNRSLIPNLAQKLTAHDQMAYIRTQIEERKKAKG